MLRAQTLVTLKEYHSALFDVNRLIELNPSSEVYQDLEARLKTQLVLPQYYLEKQFIDPHTSVLKFCCLLLSLWSRKVPSSNT